MAIPHAIFHAYHPLVNPRRQKLIAAQNFENGWVVGKAYYLFTHGKFYEYFYKSLPESTDYAFSLVTGSNAFAINSSTGEITISNISNFTATTIITVRCTFKGSYFEDQEIEVIRIPTANAVYLDFANDGFADGTKANPYKRARAYPSSTRYGKTFFYKSGTTTTEEYLTMINDISDPWTNFARWGTGNKPIIDLINNTEPQRFMDVGGPGTGAPPAFNIRVIELDFRYSGDNNNYMFRVRGESRNFEMYNCDFDGVRFANGFIWCPATSTSVAIPYDVDNPDRVWSNIKFLNFKAQISNNDGARALKMECGGNFAENIYAFTDFVNATSVGVSAVDMPGTYCSWLYQDILNTSRGPNIRVGKQTYVNCYTKGPSASYVVLNNNQSDFQSVDISVGPSYPVDGSSFFKNCIAENASLEAVSFVNSENTSVAAPSTTVGISGIITIGCANGVKFDGNCRNITVKSSILTGCSNNGIWHASGTGNKIQNCTIVKNTSTHVRVASGSLAVINSIYGTSSGTIVQTTNSSNISDFKDFDNNDFRVVSGSDLIGAGTHQGTEVDVIGQTFDNPPTIGAWEVLGSEPPPPPLQFSISFEISNGSATSNPSGPQVAGTVRTLTAVMDDGYAFDGWYLNSTLLSMSNPYNFTQPSANVVIEGRSELIPVPVPETGGKKCKTYLNGFFFEYDCAEIEKDTDMKVRGIKYKVLEDLEYEPVTVEFLKQHIRVDFDMDDNLITNYLKSARQTLEKYGSLSFGVKKIRFSALNLVDNFPLDYGPIASIVDDTYELFGDTVTNAGGEKITFDFLTGWEPELPEDIKVAICQFAAGLYADRENILSVTTRGYMDQAKKVIDGYRNFHVV